MANGNGKKFRFISLFAAKPNKTVLLLIIIITGILAIFVLFKIGYVGLPNADFNSKESHPPKPQIKTTSLSTSSAMPAQLLTVYGKGFDRTDSLSVRFFDQKGYDITLAPAQVTDTGVIVAVPPYVDFEHYAFGPGTVNVQILSQSGANASDSVTLDIDDLPKFTETPGTITLQFLDEAILQIEDTKRHLSAVENISGGSFRAADFIVSLNRLAAGYSALEKEVKSVMADKSKQVPFAQIGGQTLYYNQETLATADRVFGSLMQTRQTPISSNLFLGVAVANAAGEASCRRLQGLDLSVVIACVQKRVSFYDGLESLIEAANEKYFNNPLLEKTFNLKSFLSDVTFLGLTLPATVTAYNEDLAAITAATGKSEYEIAQGLRDYYLNDLALKVLDRMIPFSGTTLGIIQDLIIGPSDVLYRNGFKGILLASSAGPLPAHLSVDPGRLPDQSGLNLIQCGDLCNVKQKDFAVMAGVRGGGRITSAPAGISCPGDCTEIYGGNIDAVELSAEPDQGYVFSGWSLACSGKGACRLPFGRDRGVIATFEKELKQDVNAPEDADQPAADGSVEMDGNRLCDPGEDPKKVNCIPIKRGTPFFGR